MPSSHLILCRPLLLLSPIPPSIRVFSNESTLRIRWPKYWSFSFSISPSSEHSGRPIAPQTKLLMISSLVLHALFPVMLKSLSWTPFHHSLCSSYSSLLWVHTYLFPLQLCTLHITSTLLSYISHSAYTISNHSSTLVLNVPSRSSLISHMPHHRVS